MPQSGFCFDSRCPQEIRRLYECHCCSQLICLNHLIEHDEKDRFHSLTQQLKGKIDLIQSSISKRLKLIEQETIFVEREKKFVQQAHQFLDGQSYPIGDIQKILEDFHQLVQAHGLQQNVVKIEPLLFDITNYSSDFQRINHQNEPSFQMIPSQSNSSIRLDLIRNSDAKDEDQTNEEYSMNLVQSISMNQSDNSLQENKDRDDEGKIRGYRYMKGYCPLTFNGAYGLSQAKHSIKPCSDEKDRPIYLYDHLINKHKLKLIFVRRLIDAVGKNRDPMTTKLFDDHEDIIDHSSRIECPFKQGMIHLFDCEKKKQIIRVPCTFQSMPTNALKSHLKQHHHLSQDLATKLAQHCKDNRTETDYLQF